MVVRIVVFFYVQLLYRYDKSNLISTLLWINWFNAVCVVITDIFPWWRHQKETLETGEFPSQRPATRSFDVFFDLRLNKGWVSSWDTGDLRRHRTHYHVTVMYDHMN